MRQSKYRIFPKDSSQWAMLKGHFPDGIPCDEVRLNRTGVSPDSLYGWKIDFSCCFPVQIAILGKLIKRYGLVQPIKFNHVEVIIPEGHVEKALTREDIQVSCQDIWQSCINEVA